MLNSHVTVHHFLQEKVSNAHLLDRNLRDRGNCGLDFLRLGIRRPVVRVETAQQRGASVATMPGGVSTEERLVNYAQSGAHLTFVRRSFPLFSLGRGLAVIRSRKYDSLFTFSGSSGGTVKAFKKIVLFLAAHYWCIRCLSLLDLT